MGPAVTVLTDWPAVMKRSTAAAYLEVSETQLDRLVREPGSILRTFNLLPGGDVRFSRENLDQFVKQREKLGVEQKRSA